MGHQILAEARRTEALRDLEEKRPRLVVWDHGAMRVDGIDDELVFGRELLAWIEANYEEAVRFGSVRIRRPRGSGGPS